MKKILVCLMMCAACAVVGETPARRGAPRDGSQPAGMAAQPGRTGAAGRRTQAGSPGRAAGMFRNGARRSNGANSNQEEKLLDAIGEADSLEQIMPLVSRARASQSVDVRQAMVDALEARGRDCVDLLADFIGDSNEDVSNSALTAWTNILSDMKPARRVAAIQSAAQALYNRAGHSGQGRPMMRIGN